MTNPILGNFHEPMDFSKAIQGVLLHKMERRRIALFPLEESGLVGSSSFTLTTSLVTPILSSSFRTDPKLTLTRTGSVRVLVHERTFSKLPQGILVQWKLQRHKDLYIFV